jgi:PAS domain S-box-containing protein
VLVTVWESDPHGHASYQSPSWYEYTGEAPGASESGDWLRHCHPEDRRRLLAEWRKSLETDGAHLYDVKVRIRGQDGEYKWFHVSGHPIRDASGRVSKWIGTCKEVPPQAPAPVRHATSHSILVVDDHIDAVAAFALLLRHLGHEVGTRWRGRCGPTRPSPEP